jgi:pilus assembly protein Flp/PilA
MRRSSPRLKQLLRDSRGASAVEYGLILAFVVLAMFGALQSVGGVTANMWNDVSNKVTAAH